MGFLRGKEDVITERGRIRRSGFRVKSGYSARGTPSPLFFVSAASKEFSCSVNPLKSTLTSLPQVLILKELNCRNDGGVLGPVGERSRSDHRCTRKAEYHN
jgi:hypothetical protein